MKSERHLTWENFELDILDTAVPATHPINGNPEVNLFYLVSPRRIGLMVTLKSPLTISPSPYKEIEIATQMGARGLVLSVWTANELLFRPFFSVLLEIADAIQIENAPPKEAVRVAIDRFASIVEQESSISTERVTGLWGEFEVLERLLSKRGSGFLSCWNGWRSDRHDFRVDSYELEIKSTLSPNPEHVINGLQQLSQSEGFSLYIISIQLIRSDRGLTISDRVARIESLLANDSAALQLFADARSDLGLTASRMANSSDRLTLRSQPQVIPLGPAVPQLTPDLLGSIMGSEARLRLIELHYRIDVSGLGSDVTAEPFQTALPWMSNR